MKDFPLTKHNIQQLMTELQKELSECDGGTLIISAQEAGTGKWGMARLWRAWMTTTAEFMRGNGVTMPLYFKSNGEPYGSRQFEPQDAHELFTRQWLGVDENGERLSWAKSGNESGRKATKGERFIAMLRHETWAIDKGITLLKPRDSEYEKLTKQQEE